MSLTFFPQKEKASNRIRTDPLLLGREWMEWDGRTADELFFLAGGSKNRSLNQNGGCENGAKSLNSRWYLECNVNIWTYGNTICYQRGSWGKLCDQELLLFQDASESAAGYL